MTKNMRSYFKRIIAFLCTVMMCINTIGVVYAKEDKASTSQECRIFVDDLETFSMTTIKINDTKTSAKGVGTQSSTKIEQTRGTTLDGTELSDDFYFYRSTLSSTKKKVYDEIRAGIESGSSKINLKTAVSTSAILDIYSAVVYDNPEFFWCENSFQCAYSAFTGNVSYIVPGYNELLENRVAIEQQIDNELSHAYYVMGTFKKEISVVKYTHDYLIHTIDYSSESDYNQTIYSSLIQKESVCAGYAHAFQYILHKFGIPCAYVTGTVDGGDHAWNLVLLDGEYYAMDVTWDDPILVDCNGNFYYNPDFYRYDYFNLTEEQMVAYEHLRDEMASELPIAEGTVYSYENYYHGNAYGTDFDAIEQETTEEVTEPETTEEITEPETTEEVTEPETTEEITEPETTEEVTEPETTEEVTEPETTEEVTEPETTEEVTEPETTEEITEPEATEEVTEPETTEEITEPETAEEVTEPEATEEITEPETTEKVTEPEITTAKQKTISAPTGLAYVSGFTFQWQPVEEALYYEIYLDDVLVGTTVEPIFTFTREHFHTEGIYMIGIIAVGDEIRSTMTLGMCVVEEEKNTTSSETLPVEEETEQKTTTMIPETTTEVITTTQEETATVTSTIAQTIGAKETTETKKAIEETTAAVATEITEVATTVKTEETTAEKIEDTSEADTALTDSDITTEETSETIEETTEKIVENPVKVKLTSVKNNKKKGITVSWNKAENATKYVIKVGLDRKFKKTVKTKKTAKTQIVIKGLKKNKVYFVRVRAINGTMKGDWSRVKRVKIKK